MSSEVMRVAFDREPFPSDAVQYVTPSHRIRRAAHLHGGHGLLVSAEHSGSSWPAAVVVVQRVHILFGLISGAPQVEDVDFSLCFPSGDVVGCSFFLCFYVHFWHPTRFMLDVA